MASIVNGFEPLHQPWYTRWFGWTRPSIVQPEQQPDAPAEPNDPPEKTGPQASSGTLGWGCGEPMRGTPATYRQMRRMPSLEMQRSKVLNALDAGSWTVEADDDAPAGAKEAVERYLLPHRTVLIGHGAADSLDYGNACFEVVWTVRDGLTVPAYFKPLHAGGDGTTIWTYPNGQFAGLSTAADKQTGGSNGPTVWGRDCLLFTYDGRPGDLYGRSRMENAREIASKWFEIQNRTGALAKKEAGSVVKASYPPNDLNGGQDSRPVAIANAGNVASGSGYVVSPSLLHAFTKAQRERADPKDLVRAAELDLWRIENLSMGGNSPAIVALQAYAAYLDVQAARAFHQPERGSMEGTHGTKSEAGVHDDVGTMDCESWDRNFVQRCINPQYVDEFLAENWGDAARGKVRVKPQPLRDVQESIDTMVIESLFGNAATAGEAYRVFDVPDILARRGIQMRKTPLPAPAPVAPPAAATPPPGVNGNGKLPTDANDQRLMRLAASRAIWGEE
jgi:hypothetical protein